MRNGCQNSTLLEHAGPCWRAPARHINRAFRRDLPALSPNFPDPLSFNREVRVPSPLLWSATPRLPASAWNGLQRTCTWLVSRVPRCRPASMPIARHVHTVTRLLAPLATRDAGQATNTLRMIARTAAPRLSAARGATAVAAVPRLQPANSGLRRFHVLPATAVATNNLWHSNSFSQQALAAPRCAFRGTAWQPCGRARPSFG